MKKTYTNTSPAQFLQDTHFGNRSWKVIREEILTISGEKFDRGYLSQVASGNRRASDKLVMALNLTYALRLPLNPQPAPVCPIHGVVHLRKTCPASARPRAPRRDWKRLSLLLAGVIVNQKGCE